MPDLSVMITFRNELDLALPETHESPMKISKVIGRGAAAAVPASVPTSNVASRRPPKMGRRSAPRADPKFLSRSSVVAVINRPRRSRLGFERGDALRSELCGVFGASGDAVDPFVQPARERRRIARNGFPVEIKGVVAVVVALRVRGMGAQRLNDDRVDDEPR